MEATNETAEAFDALNGSLGDISGLVDALNGAFDSLETTVDSSMGGAGEAVLGLQTPIDDISGSIVGLQAPIVDIGTAFEALNAPIDTVSTSIDAISGDADAAATAIDRIGAAGTEAGTTTAAGMTDVASKVGGIGTSAAISLGEISGAVDIAKASVSSISEAIPAVETSFSDLAATATAAMGEVGGAAIKAEAAVGESAMGQDAAITEILAAFERESAAAEAAAAVQAQACGEAELYMDEAANEEMLVMDRESAAAQAFADKVAAAEAEAGGAARGAGVAAGEAAGGFELSFKSIMETLAPLAVMFGMYEGGKAVFEAGVEETNQYNSAQAQLVNQLKSSKDAIGMSASQLDALADSTSKGTAVSAAMNLTAESTLLNFNEIGKSSLPAATQAVDDLATKMAVAKGQAVPSLAQITQAAKMVGKAMEDPATGTTAFTRAMVTFSPVQDAAIKAMQKAGDTAGAQKLLMEDLASQTAGASAAAAETFQGKVAMLKKQMDDLSGGIVNGVETALEAMGVAFVNTTMFLENHKAVLALVTGALVGIGTAIFIYMLPAIGAAIVGLGGMAIAAWAAMAPFLPLIAACALLALGAYELITNWGTVCSFFQGLWKTVSEAFVTAWDATVSFLAGIWSDITGALETAWNAVSSFFVGLWNGIGSGIKTAWDTIKSFFGGIWSWITSFFTQWGPLILAVLVPFIGIPLLIWQHFSQIKDWLSGLWTDVTNGIKTFVADIAGIVPEIGTTIVNGFDSAVTFITDLPAQMLQWGEDAINGFINGIKSAATGLADAVKNVASTVASYLHFSVPDIGPLSDADTYGPDMINLISNGILSGIPNITSAAKQAAAAVSTAMQPSNVIPITAAYTAQMTGTYGASAISGPYGSAIAAGSGNGAPVYNITVSASGNVAQSNQQLATTISQVFMQNIKTLGKIG